MWDVDDDTELDDVLLEFGAELDTEGGVLVSSFLLAL